MAILTSILTNAVKTLLISFFDKQVINEDKELKMKQITILKKLNLMSLVPMTMHSEGVVSRLSTIY